MNEGISVNLPFDVGAALQGISKVNLRGGVVGKVTNTIIFVSLMLAVVAWPIPNIWLSAGIAIAIFIMAFSVLWRLISFADRHPQAALLEGSEFVMLEQIVQGTKKNPVLSIEPTDRVQPEETVGTAENLQNALKPDNDMGSQ